MDFINQLGSLCCSCKPFICTTDWDLKRYTSNDSIEKIKTKNILFSSHRFAQLHNVPKQVIYTILFQWDSMLFQHRKTRALPLLMLIDSSFASYSLFYVLCTSYANPSSVKKYQLPSRALTSCPHHLCKCNKKN
jgi:hypothetical protein